MTENNYYAWMGHTKKQENNQNTQELTILIIRK
jgi:hypothetical protein